MTLVESIILGLYFLVMVVLSVYGSHRYVMAFLYYRHKFKIATPAGKLKELPRVTVQLPVFNEMYVVERLIDAVCSIEYPRELLGDPGPRRLHRRDRGHRPHLRGEMEGQGPRRRLRAPREPRGLQGRRAGERAQARQGRVRGRLRRRLRSRPDFLLKTVPFFVDSRVGMVQVRWGHLNRGYSALTEAQSIFLDGHFVIEHTARNRSGRFFNFNGTAGIWRAPDDQRRRRLAARHAHRGPGPHLPRPDPRLEVRLPARRGVPRRSARGDERPSRASSTAGPRAPSRRRASSCRRS